MPGPKRVVELGDGVLGTLCTRCGNVKPLTEFHRSGRTTLGVASYCKACVSGIGRDWAQRNPVRRADGVKAWAARNPEKVRAKSRAHYERQKSDPVVLERRREAVRVWRRENSDRDRARKAAWRRENRERVQETNRAWLAANPDKRKAKWSNHSHRRRALKLAAFVEHVDLRVLYQRDGGRCGICGRPVPFAKASVDHIVPLSKNGPHSYLNTQIAHTVCNSRKREVGPGQLRLFGEV